MIHYPSTLSSTDALSQYATALLARTTAGASAATATASGSATSTAGADTHAATATATATDATQKLLTATTVNFKTQNAQHHLDQQQAAIGTSLKAALGKAGVALAGEVGFSLDSSGKLQVKGSDTDVAKVNAFLKADTHSPGFTSQMTTVLQSAKALSGTTQQNKAISLAARYASSASDLMAVYASLMGHEDNTAAVFTLAGPTSAASPSSAAVSTLSYPGVLSSTS